MPNDLNYLALLDQAKEGTPLPSSVLDDIRDQLITGEFRTDPYTLIHIIGRSKDLASKDIVSTYLDYRSDDPDDAALIRRLTVQVLGRMWALREYFPVIASKAFKENAYVRAVAATALGFLGSTYADLKPEAARLLLKGLQEYDPSAPEVRKAFYVGLLELIDAPFSKWPAVASTLKEDDIEQAVLERAQDLASQ